MTFGEGDSVRVKNARVHPYVGKVIKLLPVSVRVEFPRGGYGDTVYVEDFHPSRLEIVPAQTPPPTKGN